MELAVQFQRESYEEHAGMGLSSLVRRGRGNMCSSGPIYIGLMLRERDRH